MKIKYSRYAAPPSASNPLGVIVRPEVLLRVVGSDADEYMMALVDTGADETVLPLSLAQDLRIAVDVSSETQATSFAGGASRYLQASSFLKSLDRRRSSAGKQWFNSPISNQPMMSVQCLAITVHCSTFWQRLTVKRTS